MATRTSRRSVAVGFAIAVVVLAVLALAVGVDRLVARLAAVPPVTLLTLVGLAACWLVCWGVSLYVVLRVLGRPVSLGRAVTLYTSVNFANSVVPFGHAGAGPVAALLVSRASDTEYDTSLAAVASVDALNVLPSAAFVVVGLVSVASTATIDPVLAGAALLGVCLLVGALGAGALVYRSRREVTGTIVWLSARASDGLARFLPGVPALSVTTVREHVDGFFEALGHVATDRRALAVVLALSTAGWAALAASLWVAVDAVGTPVSPLVTVFVVPLAMLAVVLPLPGGAGGVEAGMVLLLVSVGGIPPAAAAAATLLYRAAVWALPVLVGGVVTVVTQTRLDAAD